MKFALLYASLLSLAEGLTLDWGDNTPEKILLEQCDDLVFDVKGTQNIWQFPKKNRFAACVFDDATFLRDEVTNTQVTISGDTFRKRKKYFFGSDSNDACNQNGVKVMVEVIPKYDVLENQICAVGGSELLSLGGDLDQCRVACAGKNDCMGFEYAPEADKTCKLFDKPPSAGGGAQMMGAACYIGQTSCPKAAPPACTMEMEMKCTINDGSGRDCKEQETLTPPETSDGTVVVGNPCNVQLLYEYEVEITTSTAAVTTQSMLRTRKGVEPEVYARPRTYDWLNEGTFPKNVIAGVTLSADSAEEVFVDFCKGGTYKTRIEGWALSDTGEVLCTGKDQYKLKVKGPQA